MHFTNHDHVDTELPELEAWYHCRDDPQLKHGSQVVDCHQWLLDGPFQGHAARHVSHDPSVAAHYIASDTTMKIKFRNHMKALGRRHFLRINRYSVLTEYARRLCGLPDAEIEICDWVFFAALGWVQDRMETLKNRDILEEQRIYIASLDSEVNA